MSSYHLAQFNIGRMLAPKGDPEVAGFFDALDEINALADHSPGFVWRLQTDAGNATDIHAYEDELLLLNLSVWDSIAALEAYVLRSDHFGYLRRRSEWFERSKEPTTCMWWIPAGHVPTIDEANKALETLRDNGPTEASFTFRKRFDPPTLGSTEELAP